MNGFHNIESSLNYVKVRYFNMMKNQQHVALINIRYKIVFIYSKTIYTECIHNIYEYFSLVFTVFI